MVRMDGFLVVVLRIEHLSSKKLFLRPLSLSLCDTSCLLYKAAALNFAVLLCSSREAAASRQAQEPLASHQTGSRAR